MIQRDYFGKWRHRYSCLLAAVLGASALLFSIAPANASTSERGANLNVGISSGITSLNTAITPPGGIIEYQEMLAYMPLTIFNGDGSITPGLATSWKYVGSGDTTFDMTIMHNAKFSDGTPLTSSAVKSWLEYYLQTSSDAKNLASVASITTPGEYTVQINLSVANSSLPYMLSQDTGWGLVASPKAVADPTTLSNSTDGVGPYVYDAAASITGSTYTYRANPTFYDQSDIRYRQITVRVNSDASSMLAAYETGQLQVALGDPSTAAAAKQAGAHIVTSVEGTEALFFTDLGGTVCAQEGNLDVRRAMEDAIDRPAVEKALLGAYGVPTDEWVRTDANDPAYEKYYTYDVKKAKSLLAAGGYPHGFTISLLAKGFGAPDVSSTALDAVAQNLSAIGVNLNITSATTQPTFFSDLMSGKYCMMQYDIGVPPLALNELGKPFQEHGFVDSTWNAKYAAAQASANAASIKNQLAGYAVQQAFTIPIYSLDQILYVSNDVHGVTGSGHGFSPIMTWSPK